MAEGGERRRPLPFKAKVELEPPAGVVGDPIGSLEEIFMDEDARKKFKPKQRSLGRFHRKIFKTPKPLISLNKIVKRIKKLPLGEVLEPKAFDIEAVKKLENIIPIMGLENLDVHSSKFLDMFSFEESSPEEKAEFYKTVVDYLIALLTKGAGELVAPAAKPNAESEDDDDDDDADDEAAGEGDEKVEAEGEDAANYSYSAEEENDNSDNLEAAGANNDGVEIEPEVDEEQLVLTTKAIVYATELEIYMCDLITLTESHYAKHKINFSINLINDMRIKCLDLSTAVQDYAEPLINKYSLQVFVDAVKSGKVKNMEEKFPVALYNQLKNRVILKPLTKEMACEDWEYCAVWLKMWLKMRDPQSARQQPALDDKEECIICRDKFTFRDMTVLDSCDHACCQECTERIATGEKDVPKKRLYIAKCPLCNGYFRTWTTRTNYIEIRNRLKRLDAFKKIVPANMIPQADVDED